MNLVCRCWPNDFEFSKIILNLFKMEMLPWSEIEKSMSRMFYTLMRLEVLCKKQWFQRDLSKLISHHCT